MLESQSVSSLYIGRLSFIIISHALLLQDMSHCDLSSIVSSTAVVDATNIVEMLTPPAN